MEQLVLHQFHQNLGGRFQELNGCELVSDYGDTLREHAALTERAGVLDLSFRSRVCLTGAERVRFLHGQVTNDIKGLREGEGCYAALVNAKGRMQSDLNIYSLTEELLLDFEPGLTRIVSDRLEKYIVADDVQIVEVGALYGLLSVQGPESGAVVRRLGLLNEPPARPGAYSKIVDQTAGELYLMNQGRSGTSGFDLFVPSSALEDLAEKLMSSAQALGGRACGWQALEIARIEAGIPRFGIDMDETNFPQECGMEARAVSYTKGCYIGQEVLNRIHTMGHVNRQLCGFRLPDDLNPLPIKGDKLLDAGREVGNITSTVASPKLKRNLALGYVRREHSQNGTELRVRTAERESSAVVAQLPFRTESSPKADGQN